MDRHGPGAAMADHLVLRYRLTGALIRHEPAPPGRYLLVLTPLLLTPLAPSGSGDGAVVVRIQDPRVEEMYCPGGSNPLCGTAGGGAAHCHGARRRHSGHSRARHLPQLTP